MKIRKTLKSLLVTILVLVIGTSNVLALHPSVLTSEGFKQVTDKGGIQDTNTAGENDGVFVSKTIESGC